MVKFKLQEQSKVQRQTQQQTKRNKYLWQLVDLIVSKAETMNITCLSVISKPWQVRREKQFQHLLEAWIPRSIPYVAKPVKRVLVPTILLPNFSKSDQQLPDYNQIEQRLPTYGKTELRMPELIKRDSWALVYPTRKELQVLEPMVDILTSNYYHSEPFKNFQGIP